MIVWGMGLPLGISGILGLILMGWKIIRGQWQKYGLLWIFCVVYLIWQASLVESDHALFPAYLPDIINYCCLVFLSKRFDILKRN